MGILSLVLTILIPLAAYAAGAAARAGPGQEVKPRLSDIGLIAVLWTAAIALRPALPLGRWLQLLGWAAVASIAGGLAARPSQASPGILQKARISGPFHRRAWVRWKAFSRRMGGFQSRTILSFLYFLLVLPFGLGVRILSDPLGLRQGRPDSHWRPKRPFSTTREGFREQS